MYAKVCRCEPTYGVTLVVNTASRMESSSLPMRIQAAEPTKLMLDVHGSFQFVSRGTRNVKVSLEMKAKAQTAVRKTHSKLIHTGRKLINGLKPVNRQENRLRN